MHFAPASIAFAHSLTEAMPEPITMYRPTASYCFGAYACTIRSASAGSFRAFASTGGNESGPWPHASTTCFARPANCACSSKKTKCGVPLSSPPRCIHPTLAGKRWSSQRSRRATTFAWARMSGTPGL